MRRLSTLAILAAVSMGGAAVAALAAGAASQQAPARRPIANPPGLIAFYPRVAARVMRPPAESTLRVNAEAKMADGSHVAFVSYSKRLSVLAVFTRDKFKKPEEALFLSPRYVVAKDMKAAREGKEPMVSATAGELTDWAYVYDRNADGRADYLAYLVGPLPVMPDSFPADFPTEAAGMSYAQLDYLLDHQRYVFTHVADEDFNGTVDAIVLYCRDPDRAWVKNFAAILSFGGGAPDTAWTFRDAIATPTGSLRRVGNGFARHRVEGKDVFVTSDNFESWTDVLARVNAAADSTKVRFPVSP